MKQKFDIDIFDIKELQAENNTKVINVIAKIKCIITDFNTLMEFYENNNKIENGILFVCKPDVDNTIMYQHLVLFAEHYNIKLLSFKKDTKQMLEKLLNRKKVFLVYVKSSCGDSCDESCNGDCTKHYKELESIISDK
ncbi:RNase P and RNase MRP subunit [Binucleata daphniae]